MRKSGNRRHERPLRQGPPRLPGLAPPGPQRRQRADADGDVTVFIEWCETIDAVQTGLFKKLKVPTIPDGESSRETTLYIDRAEEIVDHLAKYEYATVEQVTWLILTETGMRMGAAHGLDVDDYSQTPRRRIWTSSTGRRRTLQSRMAAGASDRLQFLRKFVR